MKERGIVVVGGTDARIEAKAKREGLPLVSGDYGPPPFAKTLFVEAGTTVPWDLLPAAWHFLERWDAAVPLWRYGTLAADLSSKADRKATESVVRDLRVLLYAHELLFVRANDAGLALMRAFLAEIAAVDAGEPRLAFLRAFYQVKPRMCVLPRSWLAEIEQRSHQDARARAKSRAADWAGKALVKVEVAPGVMVKCYQGDEAKVRAQYAARSRRRR